MRKIFLLAITALLLLSGNFKTSEANALDTLPAVQIIIDASGSMDGVKLEETKNAISSTIDLLPLKVYLRLILIGSKPTLLLDYTQDRFKIKEEISKIKASGNTSLYDSINLGLDENPKYFPNRVVVLSDGEDTTSLTNYQNLIVKLNSLKIPVDIIGLKVSNKDQKQMKEISSASGGTFFPSSDVSELNSIYLKIFSTVEASQPAKTEVLPGRQIEDISTNSFARFIDSYKKVIQSTLSILAFVVIFLLFDRILKVRSQNQIKILRKKSLAPYVKLANNSEKSFSGKINFLDNVRFPRFIERHLITIAATRHLVNSMTSLRTGVLALYFTEFLLVEFIVKNIIASFILSSVAIVITIAKFAKFSGAQQQKKFSEDLPNLLTLVSGGLKSGLSIEQTFEAYSSQNKGELAIQLRRILKEAQMGESFESSLLNLAKRMENTDLEWIVAALTIQKNVGGSLAEIIDTVLETIKSRMDIRREVRTLSAEGRLSAVVLIFLPISIFLFLVYSQKEYMAIYWTNPLGVVALIFVGLLMLLGWVWMKKVVEIKV